jgi:hypothetical protein
VQHTAVSESAGSELQSGLSSPALTSAFFAGELLSTDPPVVDGDQDVGQAAELSPFEDPLDTAQEEQIPVRVSVGVEDFDPLGLYASEPITAVGLEDAAEATLDSKELVVDIWESRPSPSSQLEVLPEVAEHRVQVPAASMSVAFQEPVHLESAVKVSKPVPIDLDDHKATVLAPSEPVLSSPVSFDPGPIPLAGDRAQAKQPAISAGATDSSELVNIVVQRVMEKLSREVIEKIAWEVVPDLAEIIIKEQVETHFKASGRI